MPAYAGRRVEKMIPTAAWTWGVTSGGGLLNEMSLLSTVCFDEYVS
jgi:hypothetical protein